MKTFVVESRLRLKLEEDKKKFKIPFDTLDLGWGNGYVIIPHWHWLAGTPYDDIDVEVHGGLTFSGYVGNCKWPDIPDNCHPDDYIVGFDTAHYMDNIHNCSQSYVVHETIKLRNQLMLLVYPLLTSA